MEQFALTISEACAASRASRTTVYEAIKAGQLRALKRGRRTIILAADLRTWLEGLPAVEPKRKHLDAVVQTAPRLVSPALRQKDERQC